MDQQHGNRPQVALIGTYMYNFTYVYMCIHLFILQIYDENSFL
jgi:hypothetical protein